MKQMHVHFRRLSRMLALLLLGVATLGGVMTATAQDVQGDPPDRVARLGELKGQVWLYSPDAGEWLAAVRNRPLTSGDRLATDVGARAELQIGSTTLRVDASSEVEIVELDDQHVSLQLHSGAVAARLRNAEAAREFMLSTDEGRFRTEAAGSYRFDRIDRVSQLTVLSGQGVYEGTRSSLTVRSGQHAEFWIDEADVAQYSLSEPVQDTFSAWINERDRFDERVAVASRYVSPEMVGAEDLDRYGEWEQSAEYGALWAPRGVDADWTPYSRGHWAHVRPWGWTWVDDAPWGFAPFHYGRWVNVRNSWFWAPGSRVSRPVYAPALVGWVGGPNVSISIGGGGPSVGWFPLAPREVYVPSYRYSPRYVREINIYQGANQAQINNFIRLPPERRDFHNRRFPHALTVVPTSVMTSRQPVARAAAEYRNRGIDREIAARPGRVLTLAAAPVAAPAVAARPADPRSIRPPAGAGRPEVATGRPGTRPGARPDEGGGRPAPTAALPTAPVAPTGPRDSAANPRNRDDVTTPARPGARPPVAGAAETPSRSPAGRPPRAEEPETATPPAARPMPPIERRTPTPPAEPRRGDDRRPLPGTRSDDNRRAPPVPRSEERAPGMNGERRLPQVRQEERAPGQERRQATDARQEERAMRPGNGPERRAPGRDVEAAPGSAGRGARPDAPQRQEVQRPPVQAQQRQQGQRQEGGRQEVQRPPAQTPRPAQTDRRDPREKPAAER